MHNILCRDQKFISKKVEISNEQIFVDIFTFIYFLC